MKRNREPAAPGEPNSLCEVLIARRLFLEISIGDLAEVTEIGRSQLFDFFSRRCDLSGANLDKLLDALGLDVVERKGAK